jgi:cytosine/creatinine deaminase
MTMDGNLNIINAILPGREGHWELKIEAGQIVEMGATVSRDKAVPLLDAKGQLLIPGLVDAHIHLDKALLLDRYPAITGTFAEALETTGRAKQESTVFEIQSRARIVIENAIAWGITTMRTHVEVDPIIQMKALDALLPLQNEYAWGITLQLAIFAQEGLTNQPETEKLLRRALEQGGNVIGSAPYVDPDPEANIRTIFQIAQDFNCDIDFHLDFLDDDLPLLLPFVIEETIRRDWEGRVCLGHMTKLAGLAPSELGSLAPQINAAGIGILALPATDLYMMAKRDLCNKRRGVAPIEQLAALGVKVGVATNNIRNLFTPFGDGDVLKICTLLAQVLQMGTTDSHQLCLEMATTRAANAIGIDRYGIEIGNIADLVLLDVDSVSAAIGTAPHTRITIKQGNAIAKRQDSVTLGDPLAIL